MKTKKKYIKVLRVIIIALSILIIPSGIFYHKWNNLSPDKSCASCHEIETSVLTFSKSSHRDMHCKECHGTALSNGFHSMKEKGKMVVAHVNEEIPDKIRIEEEELLNIMDNCKRCHTSQFAAWKSGGHSLNYSDFLLDSVHNRTELLNSDCLRCHGMFYNGITADLVKPINTKGPWKLLKNDKANQPAIPCMACHQIHSEGDSTFVPDYSNPGSIFYSKTKEFPVASFYDRHEKVYVSASLLPKLKLIKENIPVKVSDEPMMRICVQCHAPNGLHQAGTSDDRTPGGVHEGLSCISCHEPHSNNARNSCDNCHPAISNCKKDVHTMNTTYADKNSPNNIHWVACTDCHKNDNRILKSR